MNKQTMIDSLPEELKKIATTDHGFKMIEDMMITLLPLMINSEGKQKVLNTLENDMVWINQAITSCESRVVKGALILISERITSLINSIKKYPKR